MSIFEVIPKTLAAIEEPRPTSQIKVTQHRKRRLLELKDQRKQLKKAARIKRQNEEWVKLEVEGKVVPEWYKENNKSKKRKRKT